MAGIGYPLIWPAAHYEGGLVPASVADLDQRTRDQEQRTQFASQDARYDAGQGFTATGQWAWANPTVSLTVREPRPFVLWQASFEYTVACGGGMACAVDSTLCGSFGVLLGGVDSGKVANAFVRSGYYAMSVNWRVAKAPAGASSVRLGIEAFTGYTITVRNVRIKAGAL